MRHFFLLALSCFLVCSFPTVLFAEGAPKRISLGVLLPLSRSDAKIGREIRDGILLAHQDIEKEIGEEKKQAKKQAKKQGIELHIEDVSRSPKEALSAARKLELSHGIDVFLGPLGSGAARALAAAIPSRLFLGFTNCDPKLADYPNLLCFYPSYTEQLKTLGSYLKGLPVEREPRRSLILLEESESVYQTEAYIRELIKGGLLGEARIERALPDTTDYRPFFLKKRDADFLFLQGDFQRIHYALRQAKEVGVKARMRVVFTDPDFSVLRNEQEAWEGVLFPGWFQNIQPDFLQRFEEKYGYPATLYAALSYDGTSAILRALLLDKRRSPGALVEKLSELQHTAVSSGFRFDKTGNVNLDLELAELRRGRLSKIVPEPANE